VRTALRRARSPGRTTSSRLSAMMRATCAVHGPIPGISVSAATSSSSASVRPAPSRQAARRQALGEVAKCADLPHGQSRSRNFAGSVPSTSAADGRRPRTVPQCAPRSSGSPRPTAAPTIWNSRAPNRSSAAAQSSTAVGRNPAGAAMSPGQHRVSRAQMAPRLLQQSVPPTPAWPARPRRSHSAVTPSAAGQ